MKVREATVHQPAAGAPPPAARPAVVSASFARVVDAAVGGVRAVREDAAAVEAALLPAQPGHSKHDRARALSELVTCTGKAQFKSNDWIEVDEI